MATTQAYLALIIKDVGVLLLQVLIYTAYFQAFGILLTILSGMPTTAFSFIYIRSMVLGAQYPVAVRGVVYLITAGILAIYISHWPSDNVQCVTQSNLPWNEYSSVPFSYNGHTYKVSAADGARLIKRVQDLDSDSGC